MTDAQQPLFTRRTLLAGFLLIALFVVALQLMGRPWICKYGFGIWSTAISKCTSQHLLDPYTLSHVLHGLIFYWVLRPLASRVVLPWRVFFAVAVEIGWEILENSPWAIVRYRNTTASLDYTGDSTLNSLIDVAATILGVTFAARFSWKAAIAMFIGFELWALYLARDNLTLNIWMFLFPNEAIKQWQLTQ